MSSTCFSSLLSRCPKTQEPTSLCNKIQLLPDFFPLLFLVVEDGAKSNQWHGVWELKVLRLVVDLFITVEMESIGGMRSIIQKNGKEAFSISCLHLMHWSPSLPWYVFLSFFFLIFFFCLLLFGPFMNWIVVVYFSFQKVFFSQNVYRQYSCWGFVLNYRKTGITCKFKFMEDSILWDGNLWKMKTIYG